MKPVRANKYPFMCYLNEAEKEALETLAAKSGMSRASYMRALILLAKENGTILHTTVQVTVVREDQT